jgi:octaprenyl-diphosphate synthase
MNKASIMANDLTDIGMAKVENTLNAIISSDVEVLHDASRHIVASGGKRVRPRLAILSYLAAGGQDVDAIVPLAAAVEMVHTATLVHDDINDHSLTRRGKLAVHAKWGRTFALLTGDYLFTKVYELMAPFGADYNVIMAHACISLVEGETLQAAAAKAGTMDRQTYKKIISRKTASLFEAGARMGALLAGADHQMIDALAEYAYNLGLTFQIIDDLLDIIGDPETMGKPAGVDLGQSRGVMAAQNGGSAKLQQAAQSVTSVLEPDPLQQMLANLRSSGAIELVRLQAVETAQRARIALNSIPTSSYRDEMLDLVDQVLDRDR